VSTRPSALPAAEAVPARGRVRAALLAQVALVAAALTLYLLVVVQATGRHQDFNAYLRAASDLWDGRPLYATFLNHPFPDATLRPAFIYPPTFALLVAPLALLPGQVGALIWLALCQACLIGALALVLRATRPGAWATTALLCATFTFYPLWVDAIQGQANLPILLLVTAGILATVQGRPHWAAGIGVAAAFKLTPLLLLVWLLLERRFRAVGFLLAGFAAATAAGVAVRPEDSFTFFTRVLPALAKGTAFYGNHSLGGILDRILSPNPYTQPWVSTSLATAVALLGCLLLLAWWLWRGRQDSALSGALAFLPLLPLISTVTWSHHLVILLPVIWLAIGSLARRNWPLAETGCLVAISLSLSLMARLPLGPAFGQPGFTAAQTMDPLVFLFANCLFIGTLILFLTGPWLLRSR
jgi:alpha-1,2-mannosyltransferase